MSIEGLQPVPVEVFGSLVTLLRAEDLPLGLSPDNADTEFLPGAWKSRGSFISQFTAISSAPAVTGLRSYVTPTLAQRLLAFTGDGRLFKESTPGTLTLISSALATSAWMKSTTLFGREFIAINDGLESADMPFHYNDTNLDRVSQEGPAAAGSAVDGAAGAIIAGAHQVIVWFVTRSGYWTTASPPLTWTAAGSKKVDLSSLPTGPSNVIERRVGFTLAGGSRFYHLSDRMRVKDNTTTTLTVDFTDTALGSGTPVDFLLSRRVLPNAGGVTNYGGLLVWWGWENAMTGWNNIQFDGGFASGGNPLGWTQGGSFGAAGSKGVGAWGDAYRITGNGSAIIGEITQNALVNPFDAAPLIEPNRAYRIRARMRRETGMAAGSVEIDIFGTTGASIDTTGLVVLWSAMSVGTWTEFEAELTPSQTILSTDLVLRIRATGTPTSAKYFEIDDIRIWPSDDVSALSTLLVSDPENPEGYDEVTGLVQASPNDGQAIRNAAVIRGTLYIVKERSLHATRNDGLNKPHRWAVESVSSTVGTPSIQGVGVGEDWFVIVARAGLYFFNGGTPIKISQEIQPTWDAISWQYGHIIWCTVDTQKKRIYIGVPVSPGGVARSNRILMLDYSASSAQTWGSLLIDPLDDAQNGRKWTLWRPFKDFSGNGGGAASCTMAERSTGLAEPFFGNALGDGKIYKADTDMLIGGDGGGASYPVEGYYDTAFLTRPRSDGQPRSSGRSLFGYLTLYVPNTQAPISLDVYARMNHSTNPFTILLQSYAGSLQKDREVIMNMVGERIQFRLLALNTFTKPVTVSKFVPWVKADPWSPVRGPG